MKNKLVTRATTNIFIISTGETFLQFSLYHITQDLDEKMIHSMHGSNWFTAV